MADVLDKDLEAAEAKLAALTAQIGALEGGAGGGADAELLASLRELRTALAKETEAANGAAAEREKLAAEVSALEADNGKLEYQIGQLKKSLAAGPPA